MNTVTVPIPDETLVQVLRRKVEAHEALEHVLVSELLQARRRDRRRLRGPARRVLPDGGRAAL